MFQPGQKVLYGVHGVCDIMGVEVMRFGKERQKFYVLQPVTQAETRCYVPVENAEAVSKLQVLWSKEELLALLHDPAVAQAQWIDLENQRKQHYRDILASGDRLALLGTMSAAYRHKHHQEQAGRKLHMIDEAFLQDAQKRLGGEFCQVFDLEPGQVGEFIRKELGVTA